MTLVRRVARPLLAAGFVISGLDHVLNAGTQEAGFRPMAAGLAKRTSLPENPSAVGRATGAVLVVGGTALAANKAPRFFGAALAAATVPSTLAHYHFWRSATGQERRARLQGFAKNVSLIGAALLTSVDTEGKPGMAWRTQAAAHEVSEAASEARYGAASTAKGAAHDAARAARRVAKNAGRQARSAAKLAQKESQILALKAKNGVGS